MREIQKEEMVDRVCPSKGQEKLASAEKNERLLHEEGPQARGGTKKKVAANKEKCFAMSDQIMTGIRDVQRLGSNLGPMGIAGSCTSSEMAPPVTIADKLKQSSSNTPPRSESSLKDFSGSKEEAKSKGDVKAGKVHNKFRAKLFKIFRAN